MIDASVRSHEIVLFRFKPEFTYAQQCSHIDLMGTWLAIQPGFIDRKCYYDEQQNRWIDVVIWESLTVAEAAMARSLEDQALAQVLSSIDTGEITMGHYVRYV